MLELFRSAFRSAGGVNNALREDKKTNVRELMGKGKHGSG
jgi:hypothetical protein